MSFVVKEIELLTFDGY